MKYSVSVLQAKKDRLDEEHKSYLRQVKSKEADIAVLQAAMDQLYCLLNKISDEIDDITRSIEVLKGE